MFTASFVIDRDRSSIPDPLVVSTKPTVILLATDVAARGIDVDGLSYVIHYQLPEQLENYTHRAGRTGRAGKRGISISFILNNELNQIRQLEKDLKIEFRKIR